MMLITVKQTYLMVSTPHARTGYHVTCLARYTMVLDTRRQIANSTQHDISSADTQRGAA